MARGGLEAAVWDLEARAERRPALASRSAAARAAKFPAASPSAFRIPSTQLLEKIETRTRRRLPAHQDEDQARLGRRRGPPGARAVSRHQADGRRQFRLHAGRHRPSQAARRVLPDDDRAAARPRRHHRSRRAAGAARRRPSASTSASAPPHHAEQAIRLQRLRHHQHQARAASAASAKPSAFTMSRRPPAFRCGAAACSKPASAARTTSRSPRCPNFVLPGDVSASKRYWKRDIIEPAVEVSPAGHHRGPRRARLRLRPRSRLPPTHHRARGVDRLSGWT